MTIRIQLPLGLSVLCTAAPNFLLLPETQFVLILPHFFSQNDYRKVLSVNIPKLSTLLQDEESLTLALNEEYVPSGEVLSLKDGDTIALIPPISGG
jgi:hypothetical protein